MASGTVLAWGTVSGGVYGGTHVEMSLFAGIVSLTFV
jgi:hypothetical protein